MTWLICIIRNLIALLFSVWAFLMATILALISCRSKGDLSFWFGRKIWVPLLLKILGVKVEIMGKMPLSADQSCVVVANHQGYLDSVALFCLLQDRRLRFIAKESLFKVPFIGWYMKAAGFISVRREDRSKAVKGLEEATGLLDTNGTTLVAFPEGTRTATGDISPFKKGPFVMAINAGVPILPVVITGSYQVWSRHHVMARPGRIVLRVLPPQTTCGMSYENRGALLESTRNLMVSGLESVHTVPHDTSGLDEPKVRPAVGVRRA